MGLGGQRQRGRIVGREVGAGGHGELAGVVAEQGVVLFTALLDEAGGWRYPELFH